MKLKSAYFENIWGKRFSTYAIFIVAVMVAFLAFRYFLLTDTQKEEWREKREVEKVEAESK